MILRLTSPMPPSVNHYTGVRTVMKNGKPLSMVYETKEAKEYKRKFSEIVKNEVAIQQWNTEVNETQHFYVDAVFYFDRIDKDAANYEKCLSDTITETQLIWKDDNVVLFRPQRIFYDSNNPRIELTIYPVNYIGIFDSKIQLESFVEKCQTCNRYDRNCSILRDAKIGRIQEHTDGKICAKYKEKKENKNGRKETTNN